MQILWGVEPFMGALAPGAPVLPTPLHQMIIHYTAVPYSNNNQAQLHTLTYQFLTDFQMFD